jgi:uncharacterized protein YegP (UPF0339 family)
MKIELWKGLDGQWYWHIVGRNGQVMATSEGYKRKGAAKKSATTVILSIWKAKLVWLD